MGFTKIYGQKEKGFDINGLIADYYVYAGENVEAGDFVEFIEGISKVYPTGEYKELGMSSEIKVGKLSDNKIVVCYRGYDSSNTYVIYGRVCTISGTTITAGTAYEIAEVDNHYELALCVLSSSSFYVTYTYTDSKYAGGNFCSVSGTTISANSIITIDNSSEAGRFIGCVQVSTSSVLTLHAAGAGYVLQGQVLNSGGSKGTIVSLGDSDSAMGIDATKTSDGKYFIVHGVGESTTYFYGMLVSVSGTTVAKIVDTQLSETALDYDTQTATVASSSSLLVTGANNDNYYSIPMGITSTTVTPNTTYTLFSSSFDMSVRARPFLTQEKASNQGIVAIPYWKSNTIYVQTHRIYTNAMPQVAKKTLGTYNSNTHLNGVMVTSEKAFVHWGGGGQIVAYDNDALITSEEKTVMEKQVKKSTGASFNAISETSGVGGTSTAHNNKVSVYSLFFTTNLITNNINEWSSPSVTTKSNVNFEGKNNLLKLVVNTTASGGSQSLISSTYRIPNITDIYYTRIETYEPTTNQGTLYIDVGSKVIKSSKLADGIWHTHSMRQTSAYVNSGISISSYTASTAGDTFYINMVYFCNLTETYGAGNEPTKEWCDANL